MYDEKFMRRAIELSAQALAKRRAPVRTAAVVVKRRDDRRRGTQSLAGEKFRSDLARRGGGDPRRMPQAQDHRSVRLRSLHDLRAVHGVRRHDADRGHRPDVLRRLGATVGRDRFALPPIASDDLRREVGLPVGERRMPAEQKLAAEAMVVLETWADAAAPGRRA